MIAVAILPDWPVPPQQATPNFLGDTLSVGSCRFRQVRFRSETDIKQRDCGRNQRCRGIGDGAVKIIPIGPTFKGL